MRTNYSTMMMMKGLITVLLVLQVVPCFARSLTLGGGITTPTFETRPDLGIRAGAFMVYPRLEAGVEYDDNIYAVKVDEESDWITELSPRIMADSTWSQHELKFDAGLDMGFYRDNPDENYFDAHFLAGGRLDIVQDSYFEVKAGYEHIYEERTSSDSVGEWDTPGRFDRLMGSGLLHHEFGRFFVEANGNYIGYSYQEVDLIGGGSDSQEYRNRVEYDAGLRLGFEWLPKVKPFIQTDFNWRRYDDEDLARRDSDGYLVGAGTQIYLGGVTTAEFWGGYLRQNYDFDDKEDFSGAWYGLSLTWNVTRLTSIEAEVEKTVKETTQIGASGISGTDAKVDIDHELLRNLIVGLSFSYTNDDYEGVDITDDYYKAMPRITYILNRNLSAEFMYEYIKRDSSRDAFWREYEVNRVVFSLTGAF